MVPVKFFGREAFQIPGAGYSFLPFRFIRLDDRMLVVNDVGEHLLIDLSIFRRICRAPSGEHDRGIQRA